MFHITPGERLNNQQIQALTIEQIIKSTPFPKYQGELKKNIEYSLYLKLKSRWENFRGPVRDINHFGILEDYGYDENTQQDLYLAIEYNLYEINQEEKINILPVSSQDLEEIGELFTIIDPIKPLKFSQKITLPNARCTCGSGKKYKKCCGR